jgi:hypothetical protein
MEKMSVIRKNRHGKQKWRGNISQYRTTVWRTSDKDIFKSTMNMFKDLKERMDILNKQRENLNTKNLNFKKWEHWNWKVKSLLSIDGRKNQWI